MGGGRSTGSGLNTGGNAGLPKKARRGQRKTLFYKELNFNGPTLVFATPDLAEAHDKVMKALVSSKSWGEFRRAIPASEFKELKATIREQEGYTASELRELVADDQPFDLSAIPGVEDAEYPSPIASIQRSILPAAIIEEYAKHWGAFNCSDIWRIDITRRNEILADLEALGYEVVERNDLEFF